MNEHPKSINEVEELAARVGITFTPDDYQHAYALAEQRRAQVEREAEQSEQSRSKTAAWVDRFNRWFPKFLKALQGIADVLITATHTTLIAFGAPVLLLLCMVVEHGRVNHGIKLFDTTEALAWMGAFVVVLGNLLLELLISWREHQAGWVEPPRYDFSLRLLMRRARYMLGGSTDWQPAPKSPAHRFKALLKVVTLTILALALAGSMRDASQRAGGDWYSAIGQILAHSSLVEMQAWIGGLLFAFAIVKLAQGLSHYVAERVVEVVAVLQAAGDNKFERGLEAAGLTAASAMFARLKERQKERRLAASMAMDMPFVNQVSGMISVTPFVTSDNDGDTSSVIGGVNSSAKQTKIDTAIDLLTNDKSLRKLSVRDLEERYPGIGRNTWSAAKKRVKGR